MDKDTNRLNHLNFKHYISLLGYDKACKKLRKTFPGRSYPDHSFTSKVVELYKTSDTDNIIIATHIMLNYIKENKWKQK